MRFPIRMEGKWWSVTPLGGMVLFALLLSALWLGVYFLRELQDILVRQYGANELHEKDYREALRRASGRAFVDSSPEKTLADFIAALRAEDVDAAMKQVTDVGADQSRAELEQAKAEGRMQDLANYYSEFILRTEYPSSRRYMHKDADTSRYVPELVIDEEGDGRWRIGLF